MEFSEKDKIALYKEDGKKAPKLEELPNETISKKFNSSLSLGSLENESFDNEVVLSKLIKAGKKKK